MELTLICVTPSMGYDYIKTLYPNTTIFQVPYSLITSNIMLINLPNNPSDNYIKNIPFTKNNVIITNYELSTKFPQAKNIHVLITPNINQGSRWLKDLENHIIPTKNLPLIPDLSLSKIGKTIYQIRPSIADLIWSKRMDFNFLENSHSYIQILFPTSSPSHLTPSMVQLNVLVSDMVNYGVSEEFFKDSLKSIRSLFNHWGLSVIDQEDVEIINDTNFRKTIGAYENHNQARLSRMLECLRLTSIVTFTEFEPFISQLVNDTTINLTSRKIWASFYNLPVPIKEQEPSISITSITNPTQQYPDILSSTIPLSDPTNKQPILPETINQRISSILNEMSRLEYAKGEKYRSSAYKKAAKTVKMHPTQLTSGKEALKLPGIGIKIAAKIDEIIETQQLQKLQSYYNDPEIKALDELASIPGIGPAKAKKLMDRGIMTIQQLRNNPEELNKLTHYAKIGLKYYDDLKQKIPRDEMNIIEQYILYIIHNINPLLTATIAGSYRRKLSQSSDVDVLVSSLDWKLSTQSRPQSMNEFIDQMKEDGFIVDIINAKIRKVTAIVRLNPIILRKLNLPIKNYIHRHMDIRFFTQSEMVFGLLYFTGSATFNIEMRNKAISKGLELSEYKLSRHNGELIHVTDERDVFRVLDMPYVEPENR